MITSSGSFSFLFNIFLPFDDPINPDILPDSFAPIELREAHIRRYKEYKPGGCVASASITKVTRDADSSPGRQGLIFVSSASESAILTMPRGASSNDLENVTVIKNYMAANVESWYRYANGPRGREANNGDLRVVIGCHKTTSWGVAAFTNSTQERQPLLLKFNATGQDTITGQTYDWEDWEYSGTVDFRAGPSASEIQILRLQDDDSEESSYENQCLFVRTLNATLRDDVWGKLATPDDSPDNSQPSDESPSSQYSSSSSSDPARKFKKSSGPQGANRSGSSTVNTNHLATELQSNVEFFDAPEHSILHPSAILNEMLLKQRPNARMAITQDWDWITICEADNMSILQGDDLYQRILEHYIVCENEGVVFLQPNFGHKIKVAGNDTVAQKFEEHHSYYVDGGDFYFKVEDSLFRVHRSFFQRESVIFASSLEKFKDLEEGPGSTSNPLALEFVAAEAFFKFIRVFYNSRDSFNDMPIEDCAKILSFAAHWQFINVVNCTIRTLEEMDMPISTRISLYQRHAIDLRFLIPHYAALCKRPEPLTLEEGSILGMETTVKIAAIRETLRFQTLRSGLTDIDSVDNNLGRIAHNVVRQILNIPAAPTPEPVTLVEHSWRNKTEDESQVQATAVGDDTTGLQRTSEVLDADDMPGWSLQKGPSEFAY